MGRIVAVEFLSLDGVFEDPAWTQPYFDEAVGAFHGDVVEEVTKLKAGEENLLIYGSGQLSEALRAAGLIDEYRLLICPIVLGEGRRLFTDRAASEFTVTDSRTAPSGMMLLTLAKA